VTVLERGDINGNRSVNIGDALACALTVGGINKPAIPNTVGDLNLNGSTNIGDCLVLALFSVRVNANLALPSVTSVSPGTPNPGDTLTVTGTGFSPAAAGNQVLFEAMGGGATRVTPSSATTTSLTVTVPSDATSGAIQVYRRDAALAGNEFPLTVNGTATPLALMTVSPFSGVARGANVTLRGLGFGTTPASNTVLFRSATGTTAGTVTAATPTALTVTVPADAVCGPVTVGAGGQTSAGRMVTVAGTSCSVQLAGILGNAPPG